MLVELRDERIQLPSPVVTPVGTMEAVYSVEAIVGDGERRGAGRVRCANPGQASELVGAAEAIAHMSGIDEQPVDTATWEWWSHTWPVAEKRADATGLLALSALDAAFWDLAAPPRAGPRRPDPRIYWSGFWLGETLDSVRREARWSAELGFDAVKMRCDAGDLPASVARFQAIADELPATMGIAVELACTGTVDYVTRLVDEIDTSRVLWVEDPVPFAQTGDTARLAAELPVPVAGGELCRGTQALVDYTLDTGLAMPILDLGYCGGPSAFAAFLDVAPPQFDTMGIHLDAALASLAVSHLETDRRIYIEVMDWWEHTTPAELRAVLA